MGHYHGDGGGVLQKSRRVRAEIVEPLNATARRPNGTCCSQDPCVDRNLSRTVPPATAAPRGSFVAAPVARAHARRAKRGRRVRCPRSGCLAARRVCCLGLRHGPARHTPHNRQHRRRGCEACRTPVLVAGRNGLSRRSHRLYSREKKQNLVAFRASAQCVFPVRRLPWSTAPSFPRLCAQQLTDQPRPRGLDTCWRFQKAAPGPKDGPQRRTRNSRACGAARQRGPAPFQYLWACQRHPQPLTARQHSAVDPRRSSWLGRRARARKWRAVRAALDEVGPLIGVHTPRPGGPPTGHSLPAVAVCVQIVPCASAGLAASPERADQRACPLSLKGSRCPPGWLADIAWVVRLGR